MIATLRVAMVVAAVGAICGCAAESGPGDAANEPSAAEVPATTTAPAPEETDVSTSYVLDHTVTRITGEEENLAAYEGKVVMVVNVASKCGFTNQYEPLEALYEERKDDGLVILGFPANNFGEQEPGSNEEIAEFCRATYGVTFPMFAKVDVTGENAHPLYLELASQPEPIGGEPEWNFTKFLINRKGEVVYRFGTRTSPDDPAVLAAIDELLAQDAG